MGADPPARGLDLAVQPVKGRIGACDDRRNVGFLVGIDIGGTFTDAAVVDAEGRITVGKAPTTPGDPSEGFFAALEIAAGKLGVSLKALLSDTDRLAHGTTVATNAVITRGGAKVGLLATAGHGDTLKIMENVGRSTGVDIQTRLHYPSSGLPEPFVEPKMVREIRERVDHAGNVVVPLHEGDVEAAARGLLEDGAEALAVAYLWSFMNNDHERRSAEIIRSIAPGASVSLSHEVAPKVGEFPRTATTVLNAYLQPIMRNYTGKIEDRAAEYGYRHGVLFMQCNGGLADGGRARERAVQTLQSGPVGGVVGSATTGAAMGRGNIITSDVGGTTLDVSVVSGNEPLGTGQTVVEQHELFLNMVDVRSIGAGGGSIGWIEEVSNSLRVGPQSAGADPGPACYGRGGTAPTVVDADLILGVLDPDNFLGGRVALYPSAAREAMEPLARRLGMSIEECAAGMTEVVNARMSDLIRRMTLERGLDPRDFTIYAYGGGGGTHAALFSRGLGISEFVVPQSDAASVWSALGVAVADVVDVYEQPIHQHAPFEPEAVSGVFADLRRQAEQEIGRDHPHITELSHERYASCKYGMQVFELEAGVPEGELDDEAMSRIVDNFERAYAERFGPEAGYREAGVQLTRVGLRVQGRVRKPRLEAANGHGSSAAAKAKSGERQVYWIELGRRVATDILDGERLWPGDRLAGPAIVELPDTTIVVRPGNELSIDRFGNAVVRLQADAGRAARREQ